MSARLISVIGPPAVGKTTLAEHLAPELPAALIREDYASNPFLAESYVGADRTKLPSQLYFVLSRVAQLSIDGWDDDGLTITDYGFCQDPIFAKLRLTQDDFALYEQLLVGLAPLVRRADLLVHLDACADTLLKRIAARGRGFEKAITTQFLSQMREAYNEAAPQQGCPVIRIDCDAVDLTRPDARGELLAQIRRELS